MSKEEIEAKLQEIAQQLAELSQEITKENDSAASLVEISIVNVMGKCDINMNVQTSGNKKMMEKVGKIINRVVDELEKEEAAEKQEADKPAEPMDMDAVLKDILSKRKMN